MEAKKNSPGSGRLLKWSAAYGVLLLVIAGFITFYVKQVYADKPDYWPTYAWRTSTPEAQGMDSAKLAPLFDAAKDLHMHSMVVVRNGYIVAEAYNHDVEQSTLQHIYSSTKSVVSALFGIASNEMSNKISPESRLSQYFPAITTMNEPEKQNILLKHLLTMTSGIDWPNDEELSTTQMIGSSNWISYILNQSMQGQPGSVFQYSNANPHLLSAVLQQVTGKTTEAYARMTLFNPLGITNFTWEKDPQGFTIGSWGLRMTARDMAKFGLLYLRGGKWEGKTVVPKDWVALSSQEAVGENHNDGTIRGYGQLWWLRSYHDLPKQDPAQYDMYSAVGYGGQRIVVVPGQNMVLVFTGMNPDSFFADKLIDDYIIPSVVSNKSIAPNAAANKQLNDQIAVFKQQTDGSTGL